MIVKAITTSVKINGELTTHLCKSHNSKICQYVKTSLVFTDFNNSRPFTATSQKWQVCYLIVNIIIKR